MTRKSVLLACGIVMLLIGLTATALALLLRHEPDFYRRATLAPGKERKRLASEFGGHYAQFTVNVKNEEKKWASEFTEQQINSFLEEDLARPDNLEKNFPEGIREPRVAIDENRFRFAFRYGRAPWSTVVSVDLNVWVVKKEPNVVAMQLMGLRAGGLPITSQTLLDRFAEALRQKDIEVNWYRLDGKPVAVVRFQPGHKSPTVMLQNLKLSPGCLRLDVGTGSSGEAPRAMRPDSLKPVGN
jgi:hypothetical protein